MINIIELDEANFIILHLSTERVLQIIRFSFKGKFES